MRDAKLLHIGSEIHTLSHGLVKIVGIREEEGLIEVASITDTPISRDGNPLLLRPDTHNVILVRTWKELAQIALDVQNASNLSGVVHSFSTIISEVRHRLESEGRGNTDNVNQHPVCQLFADKIAHLTNTQTLGHDEVSKAYKWAYDMKEKL